MAFLEQGDRGADLARCAVAALETIVLQEGRLDGMQLVAFGQSFDGGNLVAFMHYREAQAGIDPPAVDQHGARAALPMVAALLCSGEP